MLTREDEIKTVIPLQAEYQPIRTPQALAFVTKLQRTFDPVRPEDTPAGIGPQRSSSISARNSLHEDPEVQPDLVFCTPGWKRILEDGFRF